MIADKKDRKLNYEMNSLIQYQGRDFQYDSDMMEDGTSAKPKDDGVSKTERLGVH